MLDAIGQVLPVAIGVALSPVPVIAVILMLFSARARTLGPAFLLGWVLGLAVVVTVIYNTSSAADASSAHGSSGVAWGKVVVGALLVLMAVRQWRSRPAPGEEPSLPGWMDAIDSFTPVKAFGLAALLSGVNPKNLALSAAAAATVAQAGLSGSDATAALVAFVVIGSLSIAVPVVYALFGGESARHTLDGWKTWLGQNNATVMAVLLLVIGAKIIGDGLGWI